MTIDEFLRKWAPDPAKTPDGFVSFNKDLERLLKKIVPEILLEFEKLKKYMED